MSKDSKFYVPSIEEFHVGFEYEEYQAGSGDDYEAQAYSLGSPFITNIYRDNLQEGWIRVKLLDREDIESLGWKFFPQENWNEHQGDRWWNGFTKGGYVLKECAAWEQGNIVVFRVNTNDRTFEGEVIRKEECIFNGHIKNKSELKRVLKMLGI